ncbi:MULTISPECIES: tetratricopeptide repeat protein [Thermotoga]|uniref:Tetratricopeptide TPR_2 repeat protein n=1 Tax=Thermotoga neapolitana (strain ATCC 49049 / DSM 4359 / NBRC 107923 / NS-E) TaxID=309803 RepID=B9KA45_THENN|nr:MULTISPECIES: tetratricopeptide repeat protein [Thermotoga]ACM23828.1 Tetratricopeptide TPR_2 repeat protein [Thermotoga neapolitana DSM 4359]AJG39859.1 hypothetical protein TRQ7_00020 [Thermotoga sp. RQ7]KFZ21428.1 hypothetical protein LA10_08764 [Thermotoga neapolitana LA10]HBF10966.1 hypothetical protein [Thermotoga neapolitana]
MNAVEKIVRDLLSEKRITEARNLLSLFPGEFPHLELEVEYAARNWKAVKRIYESLPEELKEKYAEHYEHATSQYSIDYSREAEEALKELERKNVQGAISIVESIVKDYPELVEVIALRYKLARQRNDRKAMEKYRKLLMELDRTHPVLLENGLSSRKTGLFEILTISLLVAIFLVSLFALYIVPSSVKKESETPVIEQTVDIKPLEQRVEDVLSNIAVLSESMGKLNDLVEGRFTEVQSDVKTVSEDLESLKDLLANLNRKLSQIESALSTISTRESTPSVVYVPSKESRIERAKSLWFLGYMFYLRREYDEAIRRFDLAIEEIGEENVYFKDDVYYYRALSYYFKGDLSTARRLFEDFIEKFPDSEYTDDAEYFLKRI